jgi:uncharacterized protein (DUF2147 family)
MNKFVLTLLLFSLFSLMAYAQKSTDNFSGKWQTDKGEIIEITKNGSSFIGKAAKNKKVVIENLHFDNGKWTATIIKPKDGEKIDAIVTLAGDKINILIKKGMMSKTIVWIKS